jgi:hypothetical protein
MSEVWSSQLPWSEGIQIVQLMSSGHGRDPPSPSPEGLGIAVPEKHVAGPNDA